MRMSWEKEDSLEPEPGIEPEKSVEPKDNKDGNKNGKEKKKGKDRRKSAELVVFGFLQYIFLPVLCGFLTAGILAIRGLEKLGLNRFGFANFSTISFDSATWSNSSGLMLSAGLGCVLGMIFSRVTKFGARLGHFDFISPPMSEDAMPIPSTRTFLMSMFRLVGVPAIVILAATTALKLAEIGRLPGIIVEDRLFKVTLTGVVVVAGLGCLVMYIYDMMLSTVIRMMLRKKEVELKELN